MQRHLSPLFKMRYLELMKGGTSIGSMWYSMSSRGPALVRHHVSMETRPGLLSIGSTDFLAMGSPDRRKGIAQDCPGRLSLSDQERLRKEIQQSPRELGYDQNLWDGLLLSCHLKEHYAVSLGMRQCQRLFHKMGFTLQRPRCQPHEADSLQQEAFKKLLSVDKRPRYLALVRGRSPFTASYVAPQRPAASGLLCIDLRKSGLLRRTRLESRTSNHKRSPNFQWRDLQRLFVLPSSVYSRKTIPYPVQYQISRGANFERVLCSKPRAARPHLLAATPPELNPIERVWRITRRQVMHNRYFTSVVELRTALASHFAT